MTVDGNFGDAVLPASGVKQHHPALTSMDDALSKSRVSDNSLRLTGELLSQGDNASDSHVLVAFVSHNLDTMRPAAYEEWVGSMHRNFHAVREMVGFDYRAGTAQLCALIHGVSTLKRRVEVSQEQEFSLLVLSFVLLQHSYQMKNFFYEGDNGLTMKDVGLAKYIMNVPASELESAVRHLTSAIKTAGSAPLRAVELELAISGGLVPVLRVGGL